MRDLKVLHFSRYCFFAILVFSACSDKNKEVPVSLSQKTQVLIDRASIPGIQLAYLDQSNEFMLNLGQGNKSDPATKIDDNTIFQVGNLVEPLIAGLSLKLWEEGKIEIDEPISFSFDQRLVGNTHFNALTFAHLLSHTAGIIDRKGDTLTVDFVPGSTFGPSEYDFVLACELLENQLDRPIHELLKQWIFDPLDMKNSYYDTSSLAKNLAVGHNAIEVPQSLGNSRTKSIEYNLYTTARDYAKFLEALLLKNFLSSKAKSRMLTKTIAIQDWDGTPTGLGWTLGWGYEQTETGQILFQWNGDLAFKSLVVLNEAEQQILVCLTNGENGLSIQHDLLPLFFQRKFLFYPWLGYEKYDDPWISSRIRLEKTFFFEDSITSARNYAEILLEDSALVDDNQMNNVVWSLFTQKALVAATQLIQVHLYHHPASSQGYTRLGEAYGFAHDYQSSWKAYQQAMEIDPSTSREILPRFPWYQEAMTAIQTQESPRLFDDYLGEFGPILIEKRSEGLVYTDDENTDVALVRLSNEVFDLDNLATFRLRFVFENGQLKGLVQSFLTGEEREYAKKGTI